MLFEGRDDGEVVAGGAVVTGTDVELSTEIGTVGAGMVAELDPPPQAASERHVHNRIVDLMQVHRPTGHRA